MKIGVVNITIISGQDFKEEFPDKYLFLLLNGGHMVSTSRHGNLRLSTYSITSFPHSCIQVLFHYFLLNIRNIEIPNK